MNMKCFSFLYLLVASNFIEEVNSLKKLKNKFNDSKIW